MKEPKVIPRLPPEQAKELWEGYQSSSTRMRVFDRFIFKEYPWGRTPPELNAEFLYLCGEHITSKRVSDISPRVNPNVRGCPLSYAQKTIPQLCKEAFNLTPSRLSFRWGRSNSPVLGPSEDYLLTRAYLEYKALRSEYGIDKLKEYDILANKKLAARSPLRTLENNFSLLEARLKKTRPGGHQMTSPDVVNRWNDWRETYKSPELRVFAARMRFTDHLVACLKKADIIKA